MNKIRKIFEKEVNELMPILHETYRLIGIYQNNRNKNNEKKVLKQLNIIGKRLQFFRQYLQPAKQPYFTAILNSNLSISDRIVSLDVAVGSMHIEFSIPRAYMHRESEELRKVLELSRVVETDKISEEESSDILVKGISVSSGYASGKAVVIRKNSDYKRLPDRCIVVANMTRPELIIGIDKILAIVTDKGGSLCHAAIVAREMSIPCIVGTKNATKVIKNKLLINVDGNKGIVTKVR